MSALILFSAGHVKTAKTSFLDPGSDARTRTRSVANLDLAAIEVSIPLHKQLSNSVQRDRVSQHGCFHARDDFTWLCKLLGKRSRILLVAASPDEIVGQIEH
jgi:hypothetical protein